MQLAGVTSPIDREIAERSAVCRLPGYLAHDKTVSSTLGRPAVSPHARSSARHARRPGPGERILPRGAAPILAAVPDGDAATSLSGRERHSVSPATSGAWRGRSGKKSTAGAPALALRGGAGDASAVRALRAQSSARNDARRRSERVRSRACRRLTARRAETRREAQI